MRKSYIAVVSLSFAGAVAGFQNQATVTAVGGLYKAEGGLKVQVMGACSFDVNAIHCWDMDGQPNESLSSRVEGYYLSNGGNDIQQKFRRKNRLIVVETQTSQGGGSISLRNGDGGYSSGGQINDNSGQKTLQWLNIAVDPAVTTTEIQATVYDPSQAKTADVPFREGEKAMLLGSHIEIGASKSIPTPKPKPVVPGQPIFDGQRGYGYGYGLEGDPRGKRWSVALGVESLTNGALPGVAMVLDKEGNQIRYVDLNGKIISPVKFLESLPGSSAPTYNYGMPQSPKYITAAFQSVNSNVPNTSSILTNIDPTEIAKLRFILSPPVIVRFPGIPLDPK